MNVQKICKLVDICDNDTINTITSNACQNINLIDLVMDRDALDKIDFTFSHSLPDIRPFDQKSAGVCWICAGLTICRRKMIKRFNLRDDFSLSINHLFFWDKLEKCNHFMDYLIEHMNHGYQSEKITDALRSPCSDGGNWNYFVDLVKKYGLIPDSISKRRFSGKNTSCLNKLLKYKLREFAVELFDSSKDIDFDPMTDTEKIKDKYMTIILRIILRMVGKPIFPEESFDWKYSDKNNKTKIAQGLCALSFYKNYCEIDFDNYVEIINDPRKDHPFYKTYRKDQSYHLFGMSTEKTIANCMLNLPNSDIIKLIVKQIDQGIPVWFSCDVDKYVYHKNNIMDTKIYDFDTPFNTSFTGMKKSDRMDFGDLHGCHAMAIVGYDVSLDKKRKRSRKNNIVSFKVENSWGQCGDNKGYYVMDIEWFKMFCLEIIIQESFLKKKHMDMMKTCPMILDKNDVLGKNVCSC